MEMLKGSIVEMMLAALLTAAAPANAADQAASDALLDTAIFAGGCFWCVEQAFDGVDGVVETTSGYTGGTVVNPTYKQVSAGGTHHKEAVRVRFDPQKVSYPALLNAFWHNIDPLDAGGQFCDRGESYRSVIFVMNDAQRKAAEASKATLEKQFGKTVATEIEPAATFYPAEEYHQDYYRKNPARYKFYKWGCGRAQRLEKIWGKPDGKH
jgi:peptide-methionine (S)-S-oxide reductase